MKTPDEIKKKYTSILSVYVPVVKRYFQLINMLVINQYFSVFL